MNWRNWFAGFHLSIQIGLALSIAVVVYLLSCAFHWRVDLSEGRIFSLAPQTLQVLDQLKSEPIRVHAFFAQDQPSRREFKDLLTEYAARHPKFKFKFYDPDRYPSKVKQYKVDAYGAIVVELGAKTAKTRQVSEEALTNLLVKLAANEKKKIIFATGHGEPDLKSPTDKAGFGLFLTALEDANYEVDTMVLGMDTIPQDTQVIALVAPHIDFMAEEMNILRDFIKNGGNLLFMIDPMEGGEGKNVRGFFASFGIDLGQDVIVDKASKLFGADYLIPMVTEYQLHRITNGFRITSLFPITRSVRKAANAPTDVEITQLAFTSKNSWAETDLKALEEGNAEYIEGEDSLGPVPLAVTWSQKEGKGGRMVVFGDSDFINNSYFPVAGNKDLALNAFGWLMEDEHAISVRPKTRKQTPLFLRDIDQKAIFYICVVSFPLFLLLFGIVKFIWRRSRH